MRNLLGLLWSNLGSRLVERFSRMCTYSRRLRVLRGPTAESESLHRRDWGGLLAVLKAGEFLAVQAQMNKLWSIVSHKSQEGCSTGNNDVEFFLIVTKLHHWHTYIRLFVVCKNVHWPFPCLRITGISQASPIAFRWQKWSDFSETIRCKVLQHKRILRYVTNYILWVHWSGLFNIN